MCALEEMNIKVESWKLKKLLTSRNKSSDNCFSLDVSVPITDLFPLAFCPLPHSSFHYINSMVSHLRIFFILFFFIFHHPRKRIIPKKYL